MGYRTKKEALSSIIERVRNGRTYYDCYVGQDPLTKKERRFVNSDRSVLKKQIEEFYVRLSTGGDFNVMLKSYEAVDARKAYDLLASRNVNMTLESVVAAYLAGCARKTRVAKKVGEAFAEYHGAFEDGLHKKAVATRVGGWVNAYGPGRTMDEITARDVTKWLADRFDSAKTYNNHLTYIKSFFFWCMKSERRYLTENPLADAAAKNVAYKEPEYLGVDDTRKLLLALEGVVSEHPEWLAYAILSFLCGIRREEILRMAEMPDAAKVSMEDETIRISKPKGWTKGVCPRAFHIVPNALAWMRSFDFLAAIAGVTSHTTYQIYYFARKNGIAMPRNAGRHTFITMHVAWKGEPSQTEAMVGTSRKMRVSNYCGLASHRDGEAYFSILPSSPARP